MSFLAGFIIAVGPALAALLLTMPLLEMFVPMTGHNGSVPSAMALA